MSYKGRAGALAYLLSFDPLIFRKIPVENALLRGNAESKDSVIGLSRTQTANSLYEYYYIRLSLRNFWVTRLLNGIIFFDDWKIVKNMKILVVEWNLRRSSYFNPICLYPATWAYQVANGFNQRDSVAEFRTWGAKEMPKGPRKDIVMVWRIVADDEGRERVGEGVWCCWLSRMSTRDTRYKFRYSCSFVFTSSSPPLIRTISSTTSLS